MMCAIALDRACRLAEAGRVPGRHAARWRLEADAVREFVSTRCWSDRLGSYVRFAGAEELDASLLLGAIMGYDDPREPRLAATVDAVGRHLRRGPLVDRYRGEDGLPGGEGSFLACSFWLADALARAGRVEEAMAEIDSLLELANDVGLYAEEMDAETGEFLGNFPQGLVHLALVSAAVAVAREAAG
jgi:GH15 family glucan-1,4-alpha-glucosidase